MSATTTPVRVVNRLIGCLPREERNRFLKRCKPVELALGTILCEPKQPFRHVYFPLVGFISLAIAMDSHQPLEVALIGNEGMLGVPLVLGVDTSPHRAVVQGAGTALRMTVEQFQLELHDSTYLLRMLNRYLYVLMTQLSQTGACSHFHEIELRLACWLLMTHDRAHADHFHLTHECLADMLGVRRSSITIAAGVLQRRKLIRYSRGDITILDRMGLKAASCGCYDQMNKDYSSLLP
ncbi:Crp/Fnr family transcriptional regulator [Nitrosomonas sp.]|uniref:Crp/Fnr family transcriptional regulator n=1 Tax=Nitrosomonas sp. TaxID=42353 RepID=UPI002632736F|nr:Crp/Fnr family transcriptional regulator [Nitrosomonas sp.]MCW5601960.1 Crp/Fnr family transcriptional regulator [Nitrosomonas sp.]